MKSVSLTTSGHSQREGDTANEGEAADERVDTGPQRAARNYAHTHTHASPNFCKVSFDS